VYRLKFYWLPLLLLAASLAGCQMEAATQVADRGAGTLSMSIGLTPADISALSDLGLTSGEDFCQQVEARTKLPSGGTITQEQRGDATWCVASLPFDNLGQLESLYGELGNVSVNQLQFHGGRFLYDLDVDLSDLTPEGVDPQLLNTVELSIDWTLSPPGKLEKNNADQVENGHLLWHLQVGEINHLHAESSIANPTQQVEAPGRPGILSAPTWLWPLCLVPLCLVLIVAAGAVVVVLIMRSGRGEKEEG
jgi:hypothetical protein